MKKRWWLSLALLTPILAACNSESKRVVIPFSDEVKTTQGAYTTLADYTELQTLVEQEATFILVVGNATCICTIDFLPVFKDWIEEHHLVTYYLEFTKLQFQTEKFGIPLLNGNTPIINIFDEGSLAHYRSYNPNQSSDNTLFYDLELLNAWFSDRIVYPKFQFLTKANFDALFTSQRKMIIYIGREDCPDCSYAFNTFLVPFLKANPNIPEVYGLDVMLNGIRVPVVEGQEATTGNNTPGWTTFKTNYGMDNVLNTRFGYSTGFVPTFMYIETNGQSIQANPLIIKDMIVTYNDTTRDSNDQWTNRLTRTFFDGTRPLQYTTLNLTTIELERVPNSTTELRGLLEPYHNQAMADFFTMYLAQVDQ